MYSHLVFTGGGLSGISYLGVIRYMQEMGMHHHIHEVAGTSIGALFACLFAMDVTAGEVEEYIKEFMKQEDNITFPVLDSLMSFLNTYGLDDGSRLVKPVKHFLKEKHNWTEDKISFRDFAKKTGKNLVICATNVHRRASTYFSVNTTPDVSVYDALQASMTVPFLMRPVIIEDEMYVDGGMCDNMPVNGFKNARMNSLLVLETGLNFQKDQLPDNITNYISILCQILLKNNMPLAEMIKCKTNTYHHLLLDETPIPFLNIETAPDDVFRIVVTEDDIDAAIAYGYTKIYEFLRDQRALGS